MRPNRTIDATRHFELRDDPTWPMPNSDAVDKIKGWGISFSSSAIQPFTPHSEQTPALRSILRPHNAFYRIQHIVYYDLYLHVLA